MTHHKRLRAEREKSGITLAELKKRARLKCSIVSLSRKLSGQQPMTDDETVAIAGALGVPVTFARTLTRTVAALGEAKS